MPARMLDVIEVGPGVGIHAKLVVLSAVLCVAEGPGKSLLLLPTERFGSMPSGCKTSLGGISITNHLNRIASAKLHREREGTIFDACELPDILTEEMADLMRLYAAGAIKPHVDAAIPLADAVSAFMWLREGKNVGKVVLTF